MSMQANAELQAQEEERDRLRSERINRANRAAAAARAAIKVGRVCHVERRTNSLGQAAERQS